MKFSDELKDAREKAGLTQVKLAMLLDVSVTTVANWEQERNEPSKILQSACLAILAEAQAPNGKAKQ